MVIELVGVSIMCFILCLDEFWLLEADLVCGDYGDKFAFNALYLKIQILKRYFKKNLNIF